MLSLLSRKDTRLLTLTGVAADIFYNGEDVAGRAPADATVLVSPFEIRWQ